MCIRCRQPSPAHPCLWDKHSTAVLLLLALCIRLCSWFSRNLWKPHHARGSHKIEPRKKAKGAPASIFPAGVDIARYTQRITGTSSAMLFCAVVYVSAVGWNKRAIADQSTSVSVCRTTAVLLYFFFLYCGTADKVCAHHYRIAPVFI